MNQNQPLGAPNASTTIAQYKYMPMRHHPIGLDRYRARNGNFVRVWERRSCGFEADGLDERVEVVDDALIEAVE